MTKRQRKKNFKLFNKAVAGLQVAAGKAAKHLSKVAGCFKDIIVSFQKTEAYRKYTFIKQTRKRDYYLEG